MEGQQQLQPGAAELQTTAPLVEHVRGGSVAREVEEQEQKWLSEEEKAGYPDDAWGGEDVGEKEEVEPPPPPDRQLSDEISHIRQSATSENDPPHYDPLMSTISRTHTAPAEASRRPRMETRTTTFLRGLKRRTTGEQPLGVSRAPYSYTFDALSSDDESSSSEGEDQELGAEGVGGKWRRRGRGVSLSRSKGASKVRGVSEMDERERREEKAGRSYSRFAIKNDLLRTKGRVSRKDGRLNISINETANNGYVAKALGQSLHNHLGVPRRAGRPRSSRQSMAEQDKAAMAQRDKAAGEEKEELADTLPENIRRPHLNVVIMVIGSRGDIQPFVKIGQILKHKYGHRVRIASHPTFRDFVKQATDLEFFSVGGDPSELMAFMVKNPGLIPNVQTVVEGEIQRRRSAMGEMFEGFWRACINTTDDDHDKANLKLMGDKRPFIADAIIANPPSMAHVHVAEKLGIPLHIMFTFPYTPTLQFPHPLANIKPRKSNVDASYVNFMSYPLVEMMTWQGLGDIVNRFRESTLGLEPVSSLWAPGALYRMKVPYTYLWSPSLVPKPHDWGPEIDIGGFVFLDLASNFTPPEELIDFLNAGDPPVYIGFGSIVVDDPDGFTQMIFKAVELAGVRALVNKGWGGLGRDNANTPDNIFMLDNTPHDWLFPRVKAVVHHGGAGTTAIGLKCGKPTMIVPFFGDQPFWGAMVAEAKAGAHKCIPYKKLTLDSFVDGIKACLTQESQLNVQKIADSIAREGDGAENAVESFQRKLPMAGRHNMRCSILQDRVAVWKLKTSSLRMSALTAEILHQKGKFKWSDLKLLRHYEWNDFDGPGDPFTGSVGAVTSSLYDIGEGFGMVPVRIAKHMRAHEEHARKMSERLKKKDEREKWKAAVAAGQSPGSNADEEQLRPQMTRAQTNGTQSSAPTSTEPLSREVLDDVAWGMRKTGAALFTMPLDLSIAIAQGFHNAPRLWGDATVRKPVRITGMRSGLVAARNELGYGIYDGWTGLVKQPLGDWEDADSLPGKFAGLATGMGKGLGGFVIKNINAILAPPAYVGKGVVKYMEKRSAGSNSAKAFIRRAHIVSGQQELRELRARLWSEGDESQFEGIKERVRHGWRVYEQIWAAAHKEYGAGIGDIVGRHRLRKERRTWDVNGALENVDVANLALSAKLEGKDLGQVFESRKRERAEKVNGRGENDGSRLKPREDKEQKETGEQSGVSGEGLDKPNISGTRAEPPPVDGEERVHSSLSPDMDGDSSTADSSSKPRDHQTPTAAPSATVDAPEEDLSDATAVATPDCEEDATPRSKSQPLDLPTTAKGSGSTTANVVDKVGLEEKVRASAPLPVTGPGSGTPNDMARTVTV